MNQVINQEKAKEQQQQEARLLSKANEIVKAHKVRRSPEDRNVWYVRSSNPNLKPEEEGKEYTVEFLESTDLFQCTCKAFGFSSRTCKHLLAVCLFEGAGGWK
jgi:SWIM zinc finger